MKLFGSSAGLGRSRALQPTAQPHLGCGFQTGSLVFGAWCLGLLLLAGSAATSAEALRAGVAKTVITPTQPVRMAGYESRTNLSQGIHDPLAARAVAFEAGGRRLVIVSTDNLGFYNGTAATMRQAILEACQLQPAELFLAAIHTHSAPTLILDPEKGHPNNVAYSRTLQGQLVELVRAALDGLAPVEIAVGSGAAPVGANRRQAVPDRTGQKKIVLGRNPGAAIDREVQVLKLARTGRLEPMAVLFAYATHSTSLGPRNCLISGDIHGLAEQFLEQYLGAGVIAPGLAGASGNIDPWFRVLPGFKTTNGWIPEPVLLGTLLGEEVARVVDGLTNSASGGPIRTAFKTLSLPGKARGQTEPAADSPPAPFNVTVGRVGEVAFVGLGGEVFNELGQAIKKDSPFRHTFVFTHCNGAAGYVPTRSSYPEGGYEVQSSAFAPGADEQLVAESGRLLRQVRDAGE